MIDKNGAPVSVGSRNDWKNFYFSFCAGSGLEGNVIKILSHNAAQNTVTLDTVLNASAITAGGEGGVQGGFFNFHIVDNQVSNSGTGISVYLNVFGTIIEGNTVTNCGGGLNVAGGIMVGLKTLAYNNIARNNTFTNCGSVTFKSYYNCNGPLQYNNSFTNNTVHNGNITDLSGKTIYQFNNSRNKINVSALPQGIYFVKIETEKGTITKKFVKE